MCTYGDHHAPRVRILIEGLATAEHHRRPSASGGIPPLDCVNLPVRTDNSFLLPDLNLRSAWRWCSRQPRPQPPATDLRACTFDQWARRESGSACVCPAKGRVFAISCLPGVGRGHLYGRRLTSGTCLPTRGQPRVAPSITMLVIGAACAAVRCPLHRLALLTYRPIAVPPLATIQLWSRAAGWWRSGATCRRTVVAVLEIVTPRHARWTRRAIPRP